MCTVTGAVPSNGILEINIARRGCRNLLMRPLMYHTVQILKKFLMKMTTIVPTISICIHTRDTKLFSIDKLCRHSFISYVPGVSFKSKLSNLSILCTYFSLICLFFLWCWQILVIRTILALLVCKLIDLVGFMVCHFHWELFLSLNSVVKDYR